VRRRSLLLAGAAGALLAAGRGSAQRPAAAAENGGLMSYGTDLAEDVRRGADLLARVLRGDSPATLAVDQAARFEPVVNLRTARAMGLTIPQLIRLRADRVIE
jgi:putative ABC transport system substrate-binding protein